VRRPFAEASFAWVLLFGVRAVLYTVLILADKEGALAATSVVLGWPAFLGTLWFTYRYVPHRFRQLGVDPRPPASTPSDADTHT